MRDFRALLGFLAFVYKFQDIAQRYATIQVKFLKVLHNVEKKVAQIEAHHTIESFLFEKKRSSDRPELVIKSATFTLHLQTDVSSLSGGADRRGLTRLVQGER